MDPLTIASFGLGAAKSIFGLFDNSAAQQAHAQNVARVNAINAQNQKTHFSNLSIRARSLAKRARVPGQLRNIEDARIQQASGRQLDLDRLVDDSLMRNESDTVRMFQSLKGSRSGRMNLDSSTLADLGRANAYRRNKLMRSQDDMVTSGYLDRFAAQNMRGRLLASAGQQPIYQPYIESYTPTQMPQQNKFLDFALGMGGSAINAMTLNKELQLPPMGQVVPTDFGSMGQAAQSLMINKVPDFRLPTPTSSAVPLTVQPFNPRITPVNDRYQVGERVGYQ
tara:strand:- start:695 stop:1537 length:843 start_codon:yes stop_codon:yes gene_type:complete